MAAHAYALSGLVHPERADVNVSLAEARLNNRPPEMAGSLRFSVVKSQISATYTSEVPVANAESLRVWTESAIRRIVDTLGFTNGCGYDVEITQFFDLTSGTHLVFGVQDPVISNLKVHERLNVMDVVKLHGAPASVHLQHCFADLREAIRSPLDSGFFCYRALESLVQHYLQTHQLKKPRWMVGRCYASRLNQLKRIAAGSRGQRNQCVMASQEGMTLHTEARS